MFQLNDSELRFALPDPAWVLSRRALDHVLLNHARALGVEVLQPASIRVVEFHAQGAAVSVTADGQTRDISARTVVHADGSGRFDRTGATPARAIAKRPGVVGLKCHVRNHPRPVDGLRMRSARGAYIGAIAVEDEQATIALVASNAAFARFDRDADALIAALAPDLAPSERATPWMASGVASAAPISSTHPRSWRTGNASAAIDPIGGEGIATALWSGASAARHIHEALGATPAGHGESPQLAEQQGAYLRRYRRRTQVRRPACAAAAALFMRPGLLGVIWPAFHAPIASAAAIRAWYALTGKHRLPGVHSAASLS